MGTPPWVPLPSPGRWVLVDPDLQCFIDMGGTVGCPSDADQDAPVNAGEAGDAAEQGKGGRGASGEQTSRIDSLSRERRVERRYLGSPSTAGDQHECTTARAVDMRCRPPPITPCKVGT